MKKMTSVLLTLAVLVTMIHGMVIPVSAVPGVMIGDYIEFGKYYGEPILWRVVNQDATEGIKLFSEKILCLKAFDASGDGTDGRTDGFRTTRGSNYWEKSSLREWLNSSDSQVIFSQQPPDDAHVCDGYWNYDKYTNNNYEAEPGFLTNFLSEELSLIKPVAQKGLIAPLDAAVKDGGTGYGYYGYYRMSENIDGFYNYTYKTTTDRVSLPDIYELKKYVYDRAWDHFRYPTALAVQKSENKDARIAADKPWFYWTKTAYPGSSGETMSVAPDDHLWFVFDVNGSVGVAPTISLYTGIVPVSGDGTADSPYKLTNASVNDDIQAAKSLLPETVTLTPGIDANLLNRLSTIPGMIATGTILSLSSSNPNVAGNGTITYTNTIVTGIVIVHINKAGGMEASKTIAVTIPALPDESKQIVIILPGIFGSTMKLGILNGLDLEHAYPNLPKETAKLSELEVYDNWSFGGIFPDGTGDTGYKDFANELNKMGYKAYTCPYDWRLTLGKIVEGEYLQDVIKLAGGSETRKVILICHSMGGLVARQYIQSAYYKNDVDSLIMVGTPNNGSAFTYPILEGGQVIDKSDKLITGITMNPIAHIIMNVYNSMITRTASISDQLIFDFLYRDKKIPSVITLGAQYWDLLRRIDTGDIYNPLVGKIGFDSDLFELNKVNNMEGHYQRLDSNEVGKVKTAIFYSEDTDTVRSWFVKPNEKSDGFYPDGILQFGSRSFLGRDVYSANIKSEGDGTVLIESATYGAEGGKVWTEVPMRYGKAGEHSVMVNIVQKLLMNYVFTNGKVNMDANTIPKMKQAAIDGRTAEPSSQQSSVLKTTDEVSSVSPYLVVNVISPVNSSLVDSLDRTTGITSGSITKTEIPSSSVDKFGEGQTVISVVGPSQGAYHLNFSTAAVEPTHVYYTLEYYDGTELFQNSGEVLCKNSKDITFSIDGTGLVAENPSDSLVSYKGTDGKVKLLWTAVPGAVSYNIYMNNEPSGTFVNLGNTTALSYAAAVDWSGNATSYLYIEPVFSDNSAGLMMMSVPNSDTAEANFTADVTEGSAGLAVSFTNISIGNNSAWSWSFGDGTMSTEKNPKHTYVGNGLYTVSLTVSGPSGVNTKTIDEYVKIGKYLSYIEATAEDVVLDVGEMANCIVTAHYSDATSTTVTDSYLLLSSDDDVVKITGNAVEGIGFGDASINVLYQGKVASFGLTVRDEVLSASIGISSMNVLLGTELSEVDLPMQANLTYASGTTGTAPIMWYENTEPAYDPASLDVSQYSLIGIVDIDSRLLQVGAEPYKITLVIKILETAIATNLKLEGDNVRGITPGMLRESLISTFQVPYNYTVGVVSKEGINIPAGSQVGTGMRVTVHAGAVLVKEYSIVIFGDTTGDGKINALDLLAVKRHILGLQTLSGASATAANTDHGVTGSINALDLLKIKRHILGLEVIVQ